MNKNENGNYEYDYNFHIERLEAGQRGKYQDSYYHYKVTSKRPENEIKRFCMNVLKESYERKDMPNAFAGELLVFKKLTKNTGDGFFAQPQPETYEYKVRYLYTG